MAVVGPTTDTLEGTGRTAWTRQLLTLEPMDTLLVEPEHVRQPFNDTEDEQLWLVVGAPTDFSSTLEMSEQDLVLMYPDGPKAMPPELA